MSRIGTCLASLFAASVALACGDDEDPGTGSPDAGGNVEAVSFAQDVHPILVNKCSGSTCHSNTDNPIQPGHAAPVVSDAYEATQGESLGVPVYERILARTSGEDAYGFMPPEAFGPMPCQGALGAPGCLTQAEYDTIEEWVAQGAPP